MQAGVTLLADGGWPAVTTRAVAEEAGANVGLIHYHFGGLPDLHAAIARKAGEEVIGPILDGLLSVQDMHEALDALSDLIPARTDQDRFSRLAVELVAGALRNPALGTVLRDALRQARATISERLAQLYPSWSEAGRAGVAVLIPALLDGLMLHRVLDAALPVDQALAALGELAADRYDAKPTDTEEMKS